MKIVAGIGGRFQCPPIVQSKILQVSKQLGSQGWILRSGGADGCDSYFEQGWDLVNGQKEIFLPYKLFNNNPSPLYPPPQAAYDLIDSLWTDAKHRSTVVRALFARNCQQILGPNLDNPSDLVICWTSNGKPIGGTGRALYIAKLYNIPIINLHNDMALLDIVDF